MPCPADVSPASFQAQGTHRLVATSFVEFPFNPPVSLSITKVTCTLPKGDLDPTLALNFRVKVVQDTFSPTADERPAAIAFIRNSYFLKSDNMKSELASICHNPKRLSNSGRKTKKLQNKCLVDLSRKIPLNSKDGPYVYGEPHHYNKIGCWTHDAIAVTMSGPIVSGATAGSAASSLLPDKPKLLSSVVEVVEESCAMETETESLAFDFSKYTYAKRTSDKSKWPVANTKSILTKKILAEIMTCGNGSKLLAEHGIIPVVASPNPLNRTNSIHVPFGPLLDSLHQPLPIGQSLTEKYLYSHFRMKNGKEHHDVWLSNVWQANCIMLRLPEKNGLPLFPSSVKDGLCDRPGAIIDTMSPLGEVERIKARLERAGFFYIRVWWQPSRFWCCDAQFKK